ncbi:hypothetical protein OFC57_39615, partial [Escherichia coli]|nr:hypothetical protein [Escherichia coli]
MGFEQTVIDTFGISHEEMLAVGDYFEERIMEHFEELKVVVNKMKDHHAEFVKQMDLDFNAA